MHRRDTIGKRENVVYRPNVILPGEGASFDFAGVGGRFKIEGADTNGHFAVAYLPNIPTASWPLHCIAITTRMSTLTCWRERSALVVDEVGTAEAGTWVLEPHGLWYTFWNAGDAWCHKIEIVSPAEFESYFGEVAAAGG
jgi:hypothetical protein